MRKLIVVLAILAALAVPGAVAAEGSVSADIPLKPGWNMVSVPVVPDDPAADVVFAGAEAVYWWDQETKSYVYNPPIDPCTGYWVASTTDQVITVTGQPWGG